MNQAEHKRLIKAIEYIRAQVAESTNNQKAFSVFPLFDLLLCGHTEKIVQVAFIEDAINRGLIPEHLKIIKS